MEMLEEMLRQGVIQNASDLHLSVHAAPVYRVHGELVSFGETLTSVDTETFAQSLMSDVQWQVFMEQGELDFSFSLSGTARFRINAYKQRGYVSIAARVIPHHIPKLEDLQLPDVLKTFVEKPHGLVLVTGPTGSGKSTTLAALINYMNRHFRRHIITLEDPIEYLHRNDQSIIDQREIGLDTNGFVPALRAALRQDPDMIMIGEMRDVETIRTAITAAETGHLVLATLHTSDAVETINRIVDVFPATQQAQVRLQLSSVLQGVVSQRLFLSKAGASRLAAIEILVNTPAVANLIRSEQGHQIRSVMQTGRQFGMQTMETHVLELVQNNQLSEMVLAQFRPAGFGVM